MSGSGNGVHVLVFPYPAQGHTLPLLDLAHQLALRNITITVLTTPKNQSTLSPLLGAHPNNTIQTLVFPFPSHPSLPAGVENVRDLGNRGNLPIMLALLNLFDPILHWFRSHPHPPVAIISDFFLGWTLRLARHLNIPRIAFFSSGAFLESVIDYCWNHVDSVKSLDTFEFRDLPRSPVFKEEHLPTVFRVYKESDPDWEFLKDGMVANFFSWGCIFNSFQPLEGDYLDYLKTKMGHDRVFGVGPLNLVGTESTSRGDTSSGSGSGSGSNDHALDWLDKCPDRSVLYACFGSQKLLKIEQTEALASALEKSGVRFLWVVKTGANGQGSAPDGFEGRVAGRGLVVKGWAPQVLILNHKSVGGFLSHCGWNSVMEAIVGGVMIVGWPMEADQFVNAKLLEEMGVAVRACEGAETVPDSDELGRVIAESLNECVEVKVKSKELREEALTAVRSGGSSMTDLDRLAQELNKLVGPN